MRHLTILTITLFSLLVTTGCVNSSPKYHVSIDAITVNNATLAPTTYKLESKNDLLAQRYLSSLDKILQEQGYHKADATNTPNQIISFEYGIEKLKEESRTYVEPNIQIGFGYAHGFGQDPFSGYYRGYHPFYNNYYAGGYNTYHRTYAYYNRHLTILAKDQFAKELWRVDVSSVGASKNLRKILPLLIESAKPFLGTTTEVPVELTVEAHNDKRE